MFAKFKGMAAEAIPAEVEKLLGDLDLKLIRDKQTRYLSGGEKRKLSVALAYVGNSKIIFLDEPSSGFDSVSRRDLWDMLKNYKAGKIIILTTHYMDEADFLGDRIAIMTGGELQACGSSMFLKKRFGGGYSLSIQKKTAEKNPALD
jgi:ATP-binding cassette subfamily A (ABC1) protein 3